MLLSDTFYKKLQKLKINIKTKYIVNSKIYERNTDGSKNDDISSGVMYEKEYYVNNELKHKETDFDTRIEYTFISKEMENEQYKCPNCGMESKIKDFLDGCPYCKTHYNIDYKDKDLGSKYHYDMILRSKIYKVVTLIIDLIISIILSFIFIKLTSRTFNSIDIIKIFVYGVILSLILYNIFYLFDAYLIIKPVKLYKERQNKRQIEFWNKNKIDKKKFFNNFNYEIRKYYYTLENIIDFDILDYLSFELIDKNNTKYIEVITEIRFVYFENQKIKSKITQEKYMLKQNQNETLKLNTGPNIIKCHSCGASIDATSSNCPYCREEIRYLEEWILEI